MESPTKEKELVGREETESFNDSSSNHERPARDTNAGTTVHDLPEIEKATTQNDLESGQRTPATRVVTAQDWTGPDDPENPHNWSTFQRAYHVFLPGIFAFVITFGSSVYTPAVNEVMVRFNVSHTAALLPLSLWTVGLASGPLIAAPLSETFGRLWVYRISLLVSMLFTLGASLSQNFGSLLVTRLLGGMSGAPCLAIGAGTNADLFTPKNRALATSFFLTAPFLGPGAGPLVGGFVAQYKTWRWTQWVILFAGLPSFLLALTMKETYKKRILQQRAKRLGIEPPKQTFPNGLAAVKFAFMLTIFRPIHMLCTEPIVLFFSLYTAFTFSLLFAFFAAFPEVFTKVYGFSVSQVGLVFLGISTGVIIACATGIISDRFLYQKQFKLAVSNGKEAPAPEHRLYAAMPGSIGISVGLFWFAWTARADVHWIVPILATIPFAWGNLCIFTCAALYIVDIYGPLNGASAVAANGLLRYIMGSIFPLFTVQMYETLGIDWATSLLGFLSLIMLPIPWVFFKIGPKARAKSSYQTMKF